MDKLINKTYKQCDYISRYQAFPTYFNTADDKYIYGTTAQLRQDISYVLHKVELNDTLDKIALKYYMNATLYWVIADYNKIQDPYEELDVGSYIKVPSLGSISFNI